MKKIILILFLFLLCITCYLVYQNTKQDKIYITAVGDEIAKYKYINNSQKIKYNQEFTHSDLKTTDLLNMLKYNEKKDILHQTLKKSNIIIISIGINDIYYKLNDNTKEIYTYLNSIIATYEEILKEINKYSYQKVFVLGYYNITDKNSDLFNYINYKLNKITNNYHYIYLDLNTAIGNNPKYYQKSNSYRLNELGFKQISYLIVENLKKYDII